MVDLSAIGTAVASLKAAKDIAETMIGLRDAAAFQGKMIEFQSKIIDANKAAFAAQEERSALLEQISELKTEVTRFKTWESEKQRYGLAKFGRGTVAYILKRSEARGEPSHAICTNCYEQGVKSILQSNGEAMVAKQGFVCPRCKTFLKGMPDQLPEYVD